MHALALALALVLTPSDSLAAPCPGGQTLTRDDLRAAGVGRLSDVVRLIDGLTAVTVDGFDAEPVAGMGLPFGPRVRVLVDGQPAAGATSLEPAGLEFLPVAVGEVEAVVYCPGPGLAAGAWGGSWLDVRTRRPAPHLYGSVEFGNETGDPGPARYLDPSLPNVDRLGPDLEAGLAALGTWATARVRSFYPTDSASAGRVREALAPGRFPKRQLTAAALATSGVRLGVLQVDDLPFLPERAREIPVDRRSVQGTASGTRPLTPRTRVGGRIHAARLSLDRPPWGALPVDPAWRETRLVAGGHVQHRAAALTLGAGVQAERTAASGPGLTDGTLDVGRAWAQVDRGADRLALALTAAGGRLGGGVRLDVRRPVSARAHLALTATAGRTLLEETPDLVFWTSHRGYHAVVDSGLTVAPPSKHETATVRLALTGRPRSSLHIEAAVEGSAARGYARTSRLSDTSGRALSARLSAVWAHGPLRLRLAGVAHGAVSGEPGFRSAWRRLPAVRGIAEATVRPEPRLSLWGRLDVRSRTVWEGFSNPVLPAIALLDLGLSRGFWGGRVEASLAGRNVLGAPERGHPLGATLAPRLYVRLAARL